MNFNDKQGSTLFLVMTLTMALAIILGSLMNFGFQEGITNERSFVRVQTQNAVESLLATSSADLIQDWRNEALIDIDQLSPSKQPLKVSKLYKNFFKKQGILIRESEVKGGKIISKAQVVIDPDDPSNLGDPFRGKRVDLREVDIYGKASANARNVKGEDSKVTSYGKQRLHIRDCYIFCYGIFYNMDLEFHPGPSMDMYGDVHANGDLYMSAVNRLRFDQPVTTAQRYLHGFSLYGKKANTAQTGKVEIKNTQGNFVSDYKGTGSKSQSSSYYSSQDTTWRSDALNLWGGNVLSREHGVLHFNTVGFQDYERDDPKTATVDDDLNHAYAILEPNLSARSKFFKGASTESSKYAQKAGLIIMIHDQEPAGRPNTINRSKFQLSDKYWVTFHRIIRKNDADPNSDPKLKRKSVQLRKLRVDPAFVNTLLNAQEYTESSGQPTAGFWDKRRNEGLDIIELDIGALRIGVDNTLSPGYQGSGANAVWANNGNQAYLPENHYNGIVYVQFPTAVKDRSRKDKVIVSADKMGLVVKNAKKVPYANFPSLSSDERGFTLATNNVMYLLGHFNADGVENTGSSTTADNPSIPEPPVALIADGITALSPGYIYANSKQNRPRASGFTEVNAAMIQGIVPTGKGGNKNLISGGNHNYIRFLEHWGGKKFRYRGSMVCLFESEISNEGVSTSYYSPPIRDWGFYMRFKDGYLPPATPKARTFRITDFSFITESEYNQGIANIDNSF